MNFSLRREVFVICVITAASLVASCDRTPDKKKYIGEWRALNSPLGGRLIIADNGPTLLINDPIQPDTFTATIEKTGDLHDSHGRTIPYIYSRNHLLYLSKEYERVSDSPQETQPGGSDRLLDEAWTNVYSVYQRRTDLLPNLVNALRNIPNFDNSLLDSAGQARRAIASAALDPNKAPTGRAQLDQFELAQQQFGNALSQLLLAAQRSGELQSNQNLMSLQAQLEGTENRLSIERARFNEAVQTYNASLPAGLERRPFLSRPSR